MVGYQAQIAAMESADGPLLRGDIPDYFNSDNTKGIPLTENQAIPAKCTTLSP